MVPPCRATISTIDIVTNVPTTPVAGPGGQKASLQPIVPAECHSSRDSSVPRTQVERTTMRTVALITLLAACSAIAAPRQLSSQSRAQQIAAAFTRSKHVVAEKRGVRKEKYKDVRSEPVVKQDVTEYAGVYQVVDLGDVIRLRIGSDGRIEADGHDADRASRTFTLENAKIQGAVLTAMKVYRDGATEPFEGVFMTRTERESPTDPGITTFGLGVILATPREFAGNTYERLFYQLRP